MCGIAGIFRRNARDPSDPARLSSMAASIAHRGPDDFGYLVLNSSDGAFQCRRTDFESQTGDVLLANRRLAIIDRSPSGWQPMGNETNDVFLVFNGEIFNYLELRQELAPRHLFRSNADTEVVVHAYEEWGADCVTRFNGMWAFALWDQRTRELFCSRDRFGIKPFYYHLDNNVFIFASEIKALIPAMPARPRANEGVLSDYLLDGSLCRSSETFFEGIQRLDPAHNLVVSARGSQASRYWDYHDREHTYDVQNPAETFRDLLGDAVRLRLRSDVPVGIALSGGLDSTSILALANPEGDLDNLKAFSAVFPGEQFDESQYARLAARSHHAELFCIDYQPRDFLQDLSEAAWFLDYPATDPQILVRRQIMRLASRHVKVILEGQGADEMLAGYTSRYMAPHFIDELGRMPSRRNGDTFSTLLGSFLEIRGQDRRLAAEGLFRQLAPRFLPLRKFRTYWESNLHYTTEFLARHARRREPVQAPYFEDRLTNLLHYDHATGILPMLLKFGDALSMEFSIESRLPFLDHRLVEFTFGLEPKHKMHRGLSKGVLREAMAGVIPEAIRTRRDKVGFTTPTARWIAECMDSQVRPLLLSSRCIHRGIFDRKKMGALLTRQKDGRVHAELAIFRCLFTELWFRLFIDGEGYRWSHPGRVETQPTTTASAIAARAGIS
jgi:asparagine synthase (glutamine-hydrolysing)